MMMLGFIFLHCVSSLFVSVAIPLIFPRKLSASRSAVSIAVMGPWILATIVFAGM